MYSNYSIGGITTIINKHMLSISKNVLILYLIPFSPLHINYFIIAYHTFVYNFREKQKKKHYFFKYNAYLQFHPKRTLLIHALSE